MPFDTERALQTDDDSVVDSCNRPDYSALEIPTKSPTEYSYTQRRAELLQQIRDLGHPALINQTEMAERYGCSQQQISKDLDRLAEYIDATLGSRRELIADTVFQRCLRGLLEDQEWRKAAQTMKDYEEWLTERRDLEELDEKLDQILQQQERHK